MKGKVLNKLKYPRSYLVETDKGIKIRNNRCHLLKTKERAIINSDIDYVNIVQVEYVSTHPVRYSEQIDGDLEVHQPHRATRSGRQVIIPLRYR